MSEQTPKDPAALPRVLGLWDGIAISVGLSIGAGIFMTGPEVAGKFTTAGPVLLLWVLGAVVSLTIALTFAELGAMLPRTGGWMAYLLEAYGRPVTFVGGWQQILVSPAGLGALALMFASLVLDLFGVEGPREPIAIGTMAVLTLIAIVGTRRSAFVAKIFTTLKVAALVVIIVGGLLLVPARPDHFAGMLTFETTEGSLAAALTLGFFAVIWTYQGYDAVTHMGGEFKRPQETIPRVLLGAILLIASVYLAVNLAFVNALSNGGIAGTVNPAADIGEMVFGPTFGTVIALLIVCSIFGTMNSAILSNARLAYLLARQGLTFRVLGLRHERFETPWTALLWQLIAATAFMLLWPRIFDLLGYAVFAGFPFVTLGVASIFVFRRRGMRSPYRVPGYPLTPLVAIALNLAAIGNAIYGQPAVSLTILAVLALGIPVYYVWERVRDPAPFPGDEP